MVFLEPNEGGGPEAVEVDERLSGHCRVLHQERNKQLHVDTTTLLQPLEHKRSAMMVVQMQMWRDLGWLPVLARACLTMSSLHLQLTLHEWTGKEINGTSDWN